MQVFNEDYTDVVHLKHACAGLNCWITWQYTVCIVWWSYDNCFVKQFWSHHI